MAEDFKAAMYGAALWIVAPVHQPRNSRLNHGSGTHRARFDGDVKSGATYAIVSNVFGGRPQRHDLCMRARIASGDAAVPRPRNYLVPNCDHATNRHLAFFRGGSRFSKRKIHEREMIHGNFADSLEAGNSRDKIFDHRNIPQSIAVAGVFFMDANYPPPSRRTKTQTVFIVRKNSSDKLPISPSGSLGLSHAHQLPSDAIAPKGAPHKYANFAYFAGMEALLIGFQANEPANPIAHFGDEQRTLLILLRDSDKPLLILDRTQAAIESCKSIFDGVVEDFAKSRRIVITRRPDIQVSTLFGGSHRTILASRMYKLTLSRDCARGWRQQHSTERNRQIR